MIGTILILDGVISIQLQLEEENIFQIGRIVRIILGFVLISITYFMYIKSKMRRSKKW